MVLTGAGMSAESGIATFRDARTGLWAEFRPEELATPQAFAANPERVWQWYQWRRRQVMEADPHAGHQALTRLSEQVRQLQIITQNVDGLHQRAGARDVIELHGNILRSICSRTRKPVGWEKFDTEGGPPGSPHHPEGLARPDVVWFGESLPDGALEAAMQAVVSADIVFSIGTSTLVQPAASLPFLALESGVGVIEINPERTPLSKQADWYLQGKAGAVLPELVQMVE